MDFHGAARRLDDIDIPQIGSLIGVGEDELHAFMDVETGGKGGFDDEGRPRVLFEPHVFYRNLPKPKRDAALAAKIACKKWGDLPYGKESIQYERLERAMKIDETAALKSCSWGLTQILGENYHAAGYANVHDMIEAFKADEQNHLVATVKLLIAMGIDDDLREHRWSAVARVWNGPGYAKNNYHTKMASAYAKWARIADTPYTGTGDDALVGGAGTDVIPELAPFEVEAIQKRLRELGYLMVGKVDGKWGTNTTSAISALQEIAGLPITGRVDQATKKALADEANKKPISNARLATTIDDLKAQGSAVIKRTEKAEVPTTVAGVGSVVAVVGSAVTSYSQAALDFIKPLRDAFSSVPVWVWALVVFAFCAYQWWQHYNIKDARLNDEKTGLSNGLPDPAPSPPTEYSPAIDRSA